MSGSSHSLALIPDNAHVSSFVLRWAVNINEWMPSDPDFDIAVALLPPEEQTEVRRFVFVDDRKRAFASRLLFRYCIATAMGIPFGQVQIKRTKGKKPFFVGTNAHPPVAPNFNFNVSHEGDYVILGSEPRCVVGVDVAAPQQIRRRGKPVDDPETFFASFKDVLSPKEWVVVRSAGPEHDKLLGMFQRFWSLKEAFIKARGDGMGFEPLKRAEFTFVDGPWGSKATVAVDGVPRADWAFFVTELPNAHWASVARGPPSDVVDQLGEFKRTFKEPQPSTSQLNEALNAPNPPFTFLSISEIVSKLKTT